MFFNGSILRDLRLSFNLSRADLARELSTTEQSIWQYETGQATPQFDMLNKFTRLFGVSITYFQYEAPIPRVIQESSVAYRSNIKKSIKNTNRETTYLNIADKFINDLMPFLSLPEDKIMYLAKLASKQKMAGESLNRIAFDIRKQLGLLSNAMMLPVIEKAGVFVLERPMNELIDAYSAWSDLERPYVVLGINKSPSRRLFDLAHEFGHLLLHRGIDFSETSSTQMLIYEKEANVFASSFLLPEADFSIDFKRIVTNKTEPDNYLALKKKYGVSIAALQMRASDLNLISPKESGIFWAKMTKKGYRMEEPMDRTMPFPIPGKISAMLKVLTRNQLGSLYKQTGISRKFINQLIVRKEAT